MRGSLILTLSLLVIIAASGVTFASDPPNVIHVDDNAPNDPGPFNPNISDPCENGTRNHPFDTIQEGINTASTGYTVTVFPGVYTESIDFLGKAITVRSEGDAAIIRSPDDYAVSFYTGETSASMLSNFVIRDSYIGVFIASASPTITNVTIVKNEFGITAYYGAQPNIRSSIFWSNTQGDLYDCQVKYSCIQRGSSGQGNILADPCFADPNNNDFHLRSTRGRYWPEHDIWVLDKVSSRCIDSGDPNATPIHEPQPNGRRINMGAYGASSYASLSERIFPDFNHDGIVNWEDFAVFASYWLQSSDN